MAVNMAPRRSNTGELPIYYFQYVIIIDYVLLIARHCFVCICVFDMWLHAVLLEVLYPIYRDGKFLPSPIVLNSYFFIYRVAPVV